MASSRWWVYVIQSLKPRFNKKGKRLPGFHYVGCTTWVPRRLRQHNGEIKGGGKYTSMHRPWELRAVYGPYANQSEAMKAERALKRGKRGVNRTRWASTDSKWCPPWPDQGTSHPWVEDLSWEPSDQPFWRGGGDQ